MPLLEPKEWISEDYQIERFLGEGAFAEVYKVQHRFLGRQALKVFKTPCDDIKEVQDALSEAILLSRLGHPNIVRVFNAGVAKIQGDTHGFFTMEFVLGGTLDKYRRGRGEGPLPIQECLELVRQTAMGLSVAHAEMPPIIHRDIKPQNILVSLEGNQPRVRLADFGLAKQANPMTLMLSARGTLSYKAPEAFSNSDSAAGDIWALGCVLYYLLADRHPFPRASREGEIVKRSDLTDYRPPSMFNISVPGRLDELVADCLAYQPELRIQDAASLVTRIESSITSPSSLPPKPQDQLITIPHRDFREDQELRSILDLAKRPQHLGQASELLAQWLGSHPEAKETYGGLVSLWRRGISQ